MGLSGDFFGGTVQSETWGQDDFLGQTQLQSTKKRQRPNIKSTTSLNMQVAIQDGSPADVTISETFFAPGDRVFHQKFGMGTVKRSDGDKLEIAFDKAGEKKVISRFVRQI